MSQFRTRRRRSSQRLGVRFERPVNLALVTVIVLLQLAGLFGIVEPPTRRSPPALPSVPGLGSPATEAHAADRASGPAAARTGGSIARLQEDLAAMVASSGAGVGIALIELGGRNPQTWSLNGDMSFPAASTYKLPALIYNAQKISEGSYHPSDRICFHAGESEAGWYADYSPGKCYTRQALGPRVGLYSDNTAGHMLVDDLGGPASLNAYARSLGATRSEFFSPNTTTALDLAALWQSEARGRAGGPAAQRWLYPLLTKTAFEQGIPAGVPKGTSVVHKVGWLGSTTNDCGLVLNGPHGPYVLAVTTNGLTGNKGWPLIARISARVWRYEQAR
jgi:beta-lactamase class A